ncbi:PilZ domain-containing protein [Candidatus Nitronereus thalassa]|uniref:PilZ domain-containing protein n=1 Tax=Candidatus Nitronereus thalassa TaxID=3020898 RepID=A0ABU3K7U8_9BACT|nr:PilZ domain-containing protein [Candidatus Nitronereus thalassa]MDT7042398.1 PilZ domain-containing protein [Candidatus Nitronereus thalassa]
MPSTKNRFQQQDTPTWMDASSAVRLWISFWPQHEPAVHHLKLTNVKIHPFGLQFETHRELPSGTPLEIRLLLPPKTAMALKGTVTHTQAGAPSPHKFLTSIRFTMIRETDRKRLDDFAVNRSITRLRARCSPSQTVSS